MKVLSVGETYPVPIMNLHVYRVDTPTPTSIAEETREDLEGYYVLPKDAMSGFGPTQRKMSFEEAIQYFIV